MKITDKVAYLYKSENKATKDTPVRNLDDVVTQLKGEGYHVISLIKH